MTEGGSVWDTGPQYPEMFPEQADGTSPYAEQPMSEDVAQDTTPTRASPVDIDTPTVERPPATPPPPARATGKEPRQPGWWQRSVLGFPVWLLLAFVGVVVAVFAVIARSGDPGTNSANRIQTTVVTTTVPSRVVTTTGAPATATPATTTAPPVSTTPDVPATMPPTAPVTAAPAPPPTVPPTTVPPTAPPPAAPPTTVPTAVSPGGPAVTIIGSVGPCRFGSACLLAGFALHDFNTQPSEFVCEFSDGSRYTFRFTQPEVARACATGDPGDSITIEVDGVRSDTFTRP